MAGSESSYRQIFKATTLFGGVQFFNILITIIRGKFSAILLGAEGMGINSLFASTIEMLKNLTSLGLPQSAVRDIAAAKGSEDEQQMGTTAKVFGRWILFTALLGVAVTIGASWFLSRWLFESGDYTFSFIALSVIFVFFAFTSGTYTLLRGLRQNKLLALANVLGSLGGLVVAVPFYYFFGVSGIVPALIVSAIVTWLISVYFKRKIKLPDISLSLRETIDKGAEMVKLGVVLSFSTFLLVAIRFVLNAYIGRSGSLHDLGIYNAGVTITTGYVGLVFTAMITDYFPRLSSLIHDKEKWQQTVTHQAELVLLILGPILVLLLIAAPLIIEVLLTKEFLPVLEYIHWSVLGIFLQAIAWALGVIVVAKGDMRLKLVTEIIGKAVVLSMNIVGYMYGGIKGLGIAFLLSNMINLLLIGGVSYVKYSFRFSAGFFTLAVILLSTCVLAFIAVSYFNLVPSLIIGGIALLISGFYSYNQLNKRLDLAGAMKSFIDKMRK